MKKYLLCLAGVWWYSSQLSGQYYFYDANRLEPQWRWELGISIGLMNCLTDLGGHEGNGKKLLRDVNWKASKFCGGLFIETTRQDLFGLRIETCWGQVSAADSVLKNDQSAAYLRYSRNLHFRTRIKEFSGLISFHPLLLIQKNTPGVSPYLVFGLGYFHFQPEAVVDGAWIELQPLHTEGQGFKEYPERMEYKLRQVNVPIGVGLKYEVSAFIVGRIEFLYRILSTDYLDDVSTQYVDPSLFYRYYPTDKAELAERLADRGKELNPSNQTIPGAVRGNPANKDGYFSINLKISIVLNRRRL